MDRTGGKVTIRKPPYFDFAAFFFVVLVLMWKTVKNASETILDGIARGVSLFPAQA